MRQGFVLFGIGCLIFLGMVFFLLSGEDDLPATVATSKVLTTKEARKSVRDVTPDDILQSPDLDENVLERLPPKEAPPPAVKPPKPNPFKRPVVLAAGRLLSSNIEIQLVGISAVPINQVCKDASGAPWPCGKFAKTAFNALVRGRTIECDPVDVDSQVISTRCFIAAQDMSSWLVKNGWARSNHQTYSSDELSAKEEGKGIWRKVRP